MSTLPYNENKAMYKYVDYRSRREIGLAYDEIAYLSAATSNLLHLMTTDRGEFNAVLSKWAPPFMSHGRVPDAFLKCKYSLEVAGIGQIYLEQDGHGHASISVKTEHLYRQNLGATACVLSWRKEYGVLSGPACVADLKVFSDTNWAPFSIMVLLFGTPQCMTELGRKLGANGGHFQRTDAEREERMSLKQMLDKLIAARPTRSLRIKLDHRDGVRVKVGAHVLTHVLTEVCIKPQTPSKCGCGPSEYALYADDVRLIAVSEMTPFQLEYLEKICSAKLMQMERNEKEQKQRERHADVDAILKSALRATDKL